MALFDNCVAAWKLDDLSDATGRGNTLTNNNVVTFGSGKIGNAAYMAAASSQYLSAVNTADVTFGDVDFTWGCWIYLTDVSGAYTIAAKDGASTRGPLLQYRTGSSAVQFSAYRSGNTQVLVNGPNLSAATWYCVVCWHDATADTINIQIDNGTPVSQATGGALQATSNEPFYIGRDQFTDDYNNGRVDAFHIWKRVLNSTDRTAFYNAGTGIEFSQPTAQLPYFGGGHVPGVRRITRVISY